MIRWSKLNVKRNVVRAKGWNIMKKQKWQLEGHSLGTKHQGQKLRMASEESNNWDNITWSTNNHHYRNGKEKGIFE